MEDFKYLLSLKSTMGQEMTLPFTSLEEAEKEKIKAIEFGYEVKLYRLEELD